MRNSFRRKTTDMSFGFMCFFVHIKITKCKIMNLYVSFLNTRSFFHWKYLLLSFHTYQGDVYPAQSHFWVNMKSSTFGGGERTCTKNVPSRACCRSSWLLSRLNCSAAGRFPLNILACWSSSSCFLLTHENTLLILNSNFAKNLTAVLSNYNVLIVVYDWSTCVSHKKTHFTLTEATLQASQKITVPFRRELLRYVL